MTYSVTVTNLSGNSSQKSISEFFSFCGTIAAIHYDSASHTATIDFEKPQAAQTALMLHDGTLDGNAINVTSDSVSLDRKHPDEASAPGATTEGTDGYEQHDTPRVGIVAELLAKSYVLSEAIVKKAVEVDKAQGISTRFLNYLKGLDKTVGQKIGGPETTVSDKAKSVFAQGHAQAKSIDEQHGISKQAGDYYSRAIATDVGKTMVTFYNQTTEQVLVKINEKLVEVQAEAKRIKEAEQAKAGSAAPSTEATGYAAAGHTDVPAATTTAPGAAY